MLNLSSASGTPGLALELVKLSILKIKNGTDIYA